MGWKACRLRTWCCLLLAVLYSHTCFAAEHGLQPDAQAPGALRIAYVEGGLSVDYGLVFKEFVRELGNRGRVQIQGAPFSSDVADNRELWDWLSRFSDNTTLHFLGDGYYSAGWDRAKRAENKKALLERIRSRKDVDLILAFGTWAGQDFATDEHSVPVLVPASNDPVHSGIIASAEDSGREHVAALFDPDRTRRQISLFHSIFRFKRLGVAYEDTPGGRARANLADLEKMAAKLGFSLIGCTGEVYSPDRLVAEEALLACHRRLAERVDAMFLTQSSGLNPACIQTMLQPFIDAQIPTFSQEGAREVSLGVLLSIAQRSYADIGKIAANHVLEIMRGTKPRDLLQTFATTLDIAVNMRMAMLIGWDPPLGVLAAVDEIYQEVRNAKE